jgi:hypothetical protein
MKVKWKINDKEVSLEEFQAHEINFTVHTGLLGPGTQAYSDARPGRSMQLGCHSSEIEQLNDRLKAEGIVGVQYVPHRNKKGEVISGEVTYSNRSLRNGLEKWAKIYGGIIGQGELRFTDEGTKD